MMAYVPTATGLITVATTSTPIGRQRCNGPVAGLFDGLFGPPAPPPRPSSFEENAARAAELGVQTPSYVTLLAGEGWEVRQLQAMQVVECDYEKRPEGYELLGGFAQRGENEAGLAMPATAPYWSNFLGKRPPGYCLCCAFAVSEGLSVCQRLIFFDLPRVDVLYLTMMGSTTYSHSCLGVVAEFA